MLSPKIKVETLLRNVAKTAKRGETRLEAIKLLLLLEGRLTASQLGIDAATADKAKSGELAGLLDSKPSGKPVQD